MTKVKPGRNAPCPCGSGKKYKKCCLGRGFPAEIAPGVHVQGARAVVQFRQDSPLPAWFVSLAKTATANCSIPEANEAGVLQSILFSALAAEALVNRLLEPLVDDWAKFERKPGIEKWRRLLHTELKMPLDQEPLASAFQGLKDLVTVRNELVHAKHGPNVFRARSEVSAEFVSGSFHLGDPASGKVEVLDGGRLPLALQPDQAPKYFAPVEALLREVLEVYPEDEYQVVATLRRALDGPRPPDEGGSG